VWQKISKILEKVSCTWPSHHATYNNMIKKKSPGILILAVFVSLTACQASPEIDNFPAMTFTHLPPIRLKVKNIKLNSNFQYSTNSSNLAYKFPVSPENAVQNWAQDRLLIAGSKNNARLNIIRAGVQEIKLKIDESFIGVFKNEQSNRYNTFIEVSLEIFDETNVRQAIVIGKAEQSITVSEATSLSDRRKIWYNLIEKLMLKFDSAIQESINKNLQRYLD
jgi:hypothetical protein